MLLLKGLKEQGRLGRFFGKVTIRDQPPSNTLQKIIALKEAMADLESYLQNLNISLLKIRTIVLSGEPQVWHQVPHLLSYLYEHRKEMKSIKLVNCVCGMCSSKEHLFSLRCDTVGLFLLSTEDVVYMRSILTIPAWGLILDRLYLKSTFPSNGQYK